MTDKPQVHLDLSDQDPNLQDGCPDECPKCKVPAEHGYGMAGGGMGVYSYCPQCGQILGKTQDGE